MRYSIIPIIEVTVRGLIRYCNEGTKQKMAIKPTFVLIPRNFLPVKYYATTAELLESHGFQTRLVSLPSAGSKSPLTSNEPDVVAVRAIVEELCDSGKDFIVVAHSYGSIPTCEAIKGLGNQERLLIRLVLVAAWLLREGESPPEIIERCKMEATWARFDVKPLFDLENSQNQH